MLSRPQFAESCRAYVLLPPAELSSRMSLPGRLLAKKGGLYLRTCADRAPMCVKTSGVEQIQCRARPEGVASPCQARPWKMDGYDLRQWVA